MSRNLTAAMIAAISAATVRPILLFEAEFITTTSRYWTGGGNLVWNGFTWTGVGDLIEVSAVEESDDVIAKGIVIRVNGSTVAAMTTALTEMRTALPGSVRLALLDASNNIIADPKILFRGRLDTCEIDDSDPTKPVLALSYESELIDLKRLRELRFTNAQQMQRYPGDIGLRWIEALQDQTVTFGFR